MDLSQLHCEERKVKENTWAYATDFCCRLIDSKRTVIGFMVGFPGVLHSKCRTGMVHVFKKILTVSLGPPFRF
jgi:hypothetical protein